MSLLKILSITLVTASLFAGNMNGAAPCSCWTWDGFYVGLNAGAVRGSDKVKLAPQGLWFNEPLSLQNVIASNGSTHLSGWDFIGGGQVGYNYQAGCWLFGIEVDGNWEPLSFHRQTSQLPAPFNLTYSFYDRVERNWLVTLRPRIGYVINRFFPYITGGFAAGDIKVSSNILGAVSIYPSFATSSRTQTGWTLGGGLEYALTPRISVKAEYLYVNLGHLSNTSYTTNPQWNGYFEYRRYTFREEAVRLGINWRL